MNISRVPINHYHSEENCTLPEGEMMHDRIFYPRAIKPHGQANIPENYAPIFPSMSSSLKGREAEQVESPYKRAAARCRAVKALRSEPRWIWFILHPSRKRAAAISAWITFGQPRTSSNAGSWRWPPYTIAQAGYIGAGCWTVRGALSGNSIASQRSEPRALCIEALPREGREKWERREPDEKPSARHTRDEGGGGADKREGEKRIRRRDSWRDIHPGEQLLPFIVFAILMRRRGVPPRYACLVALSLKWHRANGRLDRWIKRNRGGGRREEGGGVETRRGDSHRPASA